MVSRLVAFELNNTRFGKVRLRPRGAVLCLSMLAFSGGCGGTQKSASGVTPAQQRCLDEANAPPKASENTPERIAISRILVRHAELAKPKGATRTRGEACVRALEARDELRDAADWADVVKSYSDAHEPNDGDLGHVTKKDLKPKLARAAFALEVKELSYVIETDEGFQIILRTE